MSTIPTAARVGELIPNRPWPIFPILGWGIGVAGNAWDVFGRKPITDADIEREEQRLREGRIAT